MVKLGFYLRKPAFRINISTYGNSRSIFGAAVLLAGFCYAFERAAIIHCTQCGFWSIIKAEWRWYICQSAKHAARQMNAITPKRMMRSRCAFPKGTRQSCRRTQNESLNGFINRAIDTQLERDNRTATEIIEQDYLPLEQTIVSKWRQEGMTDEEILSWLDEIS